jgi:hypothetical protein
VHILNAANIQTPEIDYGTNLLVFNRTVYASLIMSDAKSVAASLHLRSNKEVHSTNHTKLESNVASILAARAANRDAFNPTLGFQVSQWPTINTHACPHYPHSGHSRTERGFGLSHLQIWLEFYFFDHDVIDAMHRKVPEYISSNTYSSVSAIYTSVQNGSLYKNGIPFLDEDIMLVFEDSVTHLPQYMNSSGVRMDSTALSAALSAMSTDVLSLGSGRSSLPVELQQHRHYRSLQEANTAAEAGSSTAGANPADSHGDSAHAQHSPRTTSASSDSSLAHTPAQAFTSNAYAITRRGARRLAACYDHCGSALEEQLQNCVYAGLVTWAHINEPLFDTKPDPV